MTIAMTRHALYPLRFDPVFRQYVWGGRRLGTVLGKPIGDEGRYAESWEVVDHGADQSRVRWGELAGRTLHEVFAQCRRELVGSSSAGDRERFPLLLKFLDANQNLSVQVHPNDRQAARLDPPDYGKTEAWYIVHADPGSRIYAGLVEGIDRAAFRDAVRSNRVVETLHVIEPRSGDCVFIPAGTVHALGAGLLVAELQQSSDTTYRIYDWDRIGTDGKPRPLHVAQALDVIDFSRGPIVPVVPQATGDPLRKHLVRCDAFTWDCWNTAEPFHVGGGTSCHILTCIEGSVEVEGDPSGVPVRRGDTVLVPACCGGVRIVPRDARPAILLDGSLPDSARPRRASSS